MSKSPWDDRAVHYAALADDLCEVAGVDVVDTDDVVLLQVAVKLALAAEVDGSSHWLLFTM